MAVVLGSLTLLITLSELYGTEESKLDRKIDEAFGEKVREKLKQSSIFKDLGKMGEEVVGKRPSFRDNYQVMIDQSGMEDMTFEKAMTFTAIAAVIGGLIGYLIFGGVGALIAGSLLAALPSTIISVKRKSRLEKMRNQLPEVFDLLGRIIRAGQVIGQAMKAVAAEFPPPISTEFMIVSEMINLGAPPDVALQQFAKRCGIVEVKIFALAMIIQRETGGNLAEVLDNLSVVVRERLKMNGKIAAMTAEGRMQAYVLMALPPGMLLIMLVLNPAYGGELLKAPELLVGMVCAMSLGYYFIRQIVNFDF